MREAREALEGGRAAVALIEKALAQKLEVRHAEALFDLGNLLGERDEGAAAVAVLERALKLIPGHPGLLVNLGAQLDRTGEQDRAEQCYREVLARRPSEIPALANLAGLLFRRERFAPALETYQRLVAAAPDAPAEIWNNLGVCQKSLRQDAGAERSFRRALDLEPDSPRVLANLGFLYYDALRYEEARPLLARAHALDPARLLVAAQSLDLDLQFADWADFGRKRAEIVAAVATLASLPGQTVAPFAFLSICDDPGLQLAAARSFAWPPSAIPATNRQRPADDPAPAGRLRIGFVSAAFQEHPETRLLIGLLERIDRKRFDVYAYALRSSESEMRARVASATTVFREVERMTTDELIAAVCADEIVILFDLTGQTSHARPELFAAKPAPVQVNFLGHSGTLGAAYYDYIVTDAYTTPGAEQANFAERFWLIGECYLPCDTRRTLGETPPRQRYGLPANAFVFMSQAAPYKILPSMFEWWMRLSPRSTEAFSGFGRCRRWRWPICARRPNGSRLLRSACSSRRANRILNISLAIDLPICIWTPTPLVRTRRLTTRCSRACPCLPWPGEAWRRGPRRRKCAQPASPNWSRTRTRSMGRSHSRSPAIAGGWLR